jgi:hypothetical protein
MTDSAFRGPVSNLGSMMDSPATVQPEDGPSYAYQGMVIANLRGGAFDKDGIGNARIPAYLDNPEVVLVDNIPSTVSTTILSTAAAITSGTAVTLVTVAPGNATAGSPSHATGVPFIPFGSSTVQNVIALDFGFTTGTTTAAASTIVVVDNTMFTVGQWLVVGGAGNSGKTLSQITQVVSIVAGNTTGITVSPVPLGSLTNAPIGQANLFNNFLPPGTPYGPSTTVPVSQTATWATGLFKIWNPLQALARNVTVSTITASATGTITIRGFDVHSQAMSENVSIATGTATVSGKKAFKYIASVTPNFTDTTGTYSVGVGDVYGLPFRMDRYEYLSYCWAGINQLNTTGFVAADLTNPATATSGDVRGTLNVAGITGGSASNGVKRLWIKQTIPLLNNQQGTPLNTPPILGYNNFTN